MSDQLRISNSGAIESQPLTWDGEPLYSSATVREGLFDAEAFEQVPGQLAMSEPDLRWNAERAEQGYDCPQCGEWIPAHREECGGCNLDTGRLQ